MNKHLLDESPWQIPVPVAPTHEKIFKPGPEDVVRAVREAMGQQ